MTKKVIIMPRWYIEPGDEIAVGGLLTFVADGFSEEMLPDRNYRFSGSYVGFANTFTIDIPFDQCIEVTRHD